MLTALQIACASIFVVLLAYVLWSFFQDNRIPGKASKPSSRPEVTQHTLNPQPLGQFIVLNLMAKAGSPFQGKALMVAFEGAMLTHGDKNIYHYHEETDGHGAVIFSVASAVEPGHFDLKTMMQFSTPGITFFMELSNRLDVDKRFEVMVETAHTLATVLGGELLDAKRAPLTIEAIERYRRQVILYKRRLQAGSHKQEYAENTIDI